MGFDLAGSVSSQSEKTIALLEAVPAEELFLRKNFSKKKIFPKERRASTENALRPYLMASFDIAIAVSTTSAK